MQLYVELWVSLASLLRSYTAAHGLNGNRQATVELGEERILVRHGGQWLDLERDGAKVRWTRENGSGGTLELTEAGRLRSWDPNLSATNAERMGYPDSHPESHPNSYPGSSDESESSCGEEEMDVMAEAWARELMR
ncbi:MAG: hypothetical protein WBE76_27830 [Terracidiphilus sp.]